MAAIYNRPIARPQFEQTGWMTRSAATSDPSPTPVELPKPVIYTRAIARSQHESMGWLKATLGLITADVSNQIPALTQANASFRTAQARQLDPRLQQQGARWFGRPFDPALYTGDFQQLGSSYVTPPGKQLDVRGGLWAQDMSMFYGLPILNFIPAAGQLRSSYVTPKRKALDVRLLKFETSNEWQFTVDQLDVPGQSAALAQLAASYQTRTGKKLDVRLQGWDAGVGGWVWWIVNNPQATPTKLVIVRGIGVQTMYLA